MLFALDTATEMVSLALHDGNRLLTEITWPVSTSTTAELAPAVRTLFERAGAAPAAVSAIAVCSGPGYFSSLRAGMAFAKGLAAGSERPLVGITSLDVLAFAAPYQQSALIAAVPVGRGRVAVGRYQWRKGQWAARGQPSLMTWDDLVASLDGPAMLTGEVDEDGAAALQQAEQAGIKLTLLPATHRLRRAGDLAEAAWSRLNAKQETFPAPDLQPLILKLESKTATA
jgi:tRNA threonylcarbamoyladenosine biosynthesis protein TsaB